MIADRAGPPADELPTEAGSPAPRPRLAGGWGLTASLAALAGAGAIGLVTLVPAGGLVLGLPLIFVAPGYLLVARAAPSLGPAGRTGVAIVATTYLASHLTNAVATGAGRFDRETVSIAVGLLAALAVVSIRAPDGFLGLGPRPRLGPVPFIRALRSESVAFGLAALGVLVVGGALGLSVWHLTAGGWVSGGWNWSDFLVHYSIASSIGAGNFPPQVPYFAGVPLTYHWFADFHAEISALLSGFDLAAVMALSSGLMAGAFVLLVFELALRLSGDRRVAAVAAALALFGGGMGYLRLIWDLRGSPLDPDLIDRISHLVSTDSYDNHWTGDEPPFRIASILGTGFLAHRATAFGLPGLVAVVLLVQSSLGERPAGMALAGLLAALLAPFQFFAFPAVYLLVLLYGLATRAWRQRTWVRDATLFLGPLVLALPFIVPAIFQAERNGNVRFVQGWSEAPWEVGPLAVGAFYATNLGVPFVLALVAALRPGLPNRAFLVSSTVALFLVPNLIVTTAVEFDMNKYFQMMWIPVAILAAWLIRGWSNLAVAIVLGLSVLSPTLITIRHVVGTDVALSLNEERAARWIEKNVPQMAVFVTDPRINSPTDLVGRLRITTFGPYAANLGYDPAGREADVRDIYCSGDPETAADLMGRYGATYVLSAYEQSRCGPPGPTDFSGSPRFEVVYEEGSVTIWRLVGAGPAIGVPVGRLAV